MTSLGTIESFTGRWDGDAVKNFIYQSDDGGETWELRGPERRVRSEWL